MALVPIHSLVGGDSPKTKQTQGGEFRLFVVDMSTSVDSICFRYAANPQSSFFASGTPAAKARYIVATLQFDMR